MITHQDPSVAGCSGFRQEIAEPFQEGFMISEIPENRFTFYSADNDVMHCPGSIYAGFSRHGVL